MSSECLDSFNVIVTLKAAGNLRLFLKLLHFRNHSDLANKLSEAIQKITNNHPSSRKLIQELSCNSNVSSKKDELIDAASHISQLLVAKDTETMKKSAEALKKKSDDLMNKSENADNQDLAQVLQLLSQSIIVHLQPEIRRFNQDQEILKSESKSSYNAGRMQKEFLNFSNSTEIIDKAETEELLKQSISIHQGNNQKFDISIPMKRITITSSCKVECEAKDKILTSCEFDHCRDTKFKCDTACGSIIIDRSANLTLSLTQDVIKRGKIAYGQCPALKLEVPDNKEMSLHINNFMKGKVDKDGVNISTLQADNYNIFDVKA